MVKQEYKKTEIGMLPVEWGVDNLGSCADIYRGGSPRPIQAYLTQSASGLNWVKIGDVKPGEKYITSTQERIIPEGLSKTRQVFEGDFILSNSMSFGRPYILKLDGCIHDGWLTIQNYQNAFSTDYLYYYLSSDTVIKQYISMASGSSVQNLNKEKVAAVLLAVPPKPEQDAIAEALSDIDTLIVNLEKLIAKKKAIKQGAMQELLTGKRRLPGFDGEWKTVQIGTFTSVFSGGTPSTANPLYWGGNIPWMSSGELNMKIVREVRGRITATGMENSSTRMIPAFCVLIGLAGQGKTRGTAAFNTFPLCTNQSIAAIFPNESQFDSKFLYFYMDTQYTELRELSAGGGGRGGLTKKLIEDFYVTIPSDIKEQVSIAEILTDIDDEIENLEKELYKTTAIKQGMMSELLTGRIRLIDKEDA